MAAVGGRAEPIASSASIAGIPTTRATLAWTRISSISDDCAAMVLDALIWIKNVIDPIATLSAAPAARASAARAP